MRGRRRHRWRFTRKREAILEVLKNTSEHLSAEDIYLILKSRGVPIGLATVYRSLDLFYREGLVNRINIGDGIIRYEYIREGTEKHHHHLVCIKCGKVIEYRDEEEEEFLKRLGERIFEKYGFKVVSHEVYLYGLCRECYEKVKENKGI